MEYHQCNESKKQKKIWLSAPRKKLGFHTEFCEFRELRIFENFNFCFIESRSCPNQTKRGMEYHQCNESVKQKNFWLSAPRKKLGFHTEFCEFRGLRILLFFSAGQGVVQIKPNTVWSITSVMRVKSKKKFWLSPPRKKLGFHTEFCEFRELRIFENFYFFSAGQGVVQIKPNAVWSIISVTRV